MHAHPCRSSIIHHLAGLYGDGGAAVSGDASHQWTGRGMAVGEVRVVPREKAIPPDIYMVGIQCG